MHLCIVEAGGLYWHNLLHSEIEALPESEIAVKQVDTWTDDGLSRSSNHLKHLSRRHSDHRHPILQKCFEDGARRILLNEDYAWP